MSILKKITAVKARQNLGQLMNEVFIREDDYIIERAGKPLVAVIPLDKYKRLGQEEEEAKTQFFNWVDKARDRAKRVKFKEIEQTIDEAARAVRKQNND